MATLPEKTPFRFSLKAMMIIVALVAISSAVVTSQTGSLIFFAVALSVLLVAILIWLIKNPDLMNFGLAFICLAILIATLLVVGSLILQVQKL